MLTTSTPTNSSTHTAPVISSKEDSLQAETTTKCRFKQFIDVIIVCSFPEKPIL